MKNKMGSDIERIRVELRRCQAQMKQTRGTVYYDELFELARTLNLKLAELARRTG